MLGQQSESWDTLAARIGHGAVFEDLHTLLMQSSPLYADTFRQKLQQQLQALADREQQADAEGRSDDDDNDNDAAP